MRFRDVIILITTALIAACSSPDHEAAPMEPVTSSAQPETMDKASGEGFSFDCGPAGTADVRFLGPDTVELSFAGKSYILPQERAASGAKYLADDVSLNVAFSQ